MFPDYPSYRLEQPTSESPDLRAYKKFATDPKYEGRTIVGVDGNKITTAELSSTFYAVEPVNGKTSASLKFSSQGNTYYSQDTQKILDHFKAALAEKYGKQNINNFFPLEDQEYAITYGLRQHLVRRVLQEAEIPTREELQRCCDQITEEERELQGQSLTKSQEAYVLLKIGNLRLHLQDLLERFPQKNGSVSLTVSRDQIAERTIHTLMQAAFCFNEVTQELADKIDHVERHDSKEALKYISDFEQYFEAAKRTLAIVESNSFKTLVLPFVSGEEQENLLKGVKEVRQRLHESLVSIEDHPTLARRAALLRKRGAQKKPTSSISDASAAGGGSSAAAVPTQPPMTEEEKKAALKTAHDAVLVELDAQKLKDAEEAAKIKRAKQLAEWGF